MSVRRCRSSPEWMDNIEVQYPEFCSHHGVGGCPVVIAGILDSSAK